MNRCIRQCFYTVLIGALVSGTSVYALSYSPSQLSVSRIYRVTTPYGKGKDRNWINYSYKWFSSSENRNSNSGQILDTEHERGARLRFRYYPNMEKPVGSLGELYTTYRPTSLEDASVTVGRKVLDWNPSEQFWGLGHLHGRENMELLNSTREGLVGIIATVNPSSNFSLSLLFSPLVIPELNPNFDAKDGKVISPMEWAKLPPPKTKVLKSHVPNYYVIEMPSLDKLIFRPGGGAFSRFKIGRNSISAYWTYKPEPAVRINAEGGLTEDQTEVRVPFWPFNNYHQVYGADYVYSGKGFGVNLGVERINPDHSAVKGVELKYFKIKPTYFDASYFHARTTFNIPFLYRSNFSLNYIDLISNNIGLSDSFLDQPVRWQSAVGVSVDLFLFSWARVILKYRHDFRSKDRTFATKVKFTPYRNFFVEAAAEIVWAPDLTSYWSMYRTNDILYSNLGMSF